MSTLTPTTVTHAFHLFTVMQNHNVQCSVEFKGGQADPLLGICHQRVKVDRIIDCAPEEQTLIVSLGEAEFSFGLKAHQFFYTVSGRQIDICISSKSHSAWFNSTGMKQSALDAALDYNSEFYDKIIQTEVMSESNARNMSEHENTLIKFIRTLDFETLLDACDAIGETSRESKRNALEESYERNNAASVAVWFIRHDKLRKLQELLGAANKEYQERISHETS